ncbi:hypothetical protein D3C73_1258970 [compost metagenome]
MVENRGTCDEHIRTRCGDFADIVHLNAAINFQANVIARLINTTADFTQFFQRLRNERLPAKTGVNGHQQDHIQLIHNVVQVAQRRGRVEHQARFTAILFDQL